MTSGRITRVVITGSESTGKTMLARDLATHFGVLWVEEQARLYAQTANRELTSEDVSPIASAQIAAEDAAHAEAIRRDDRWLFLDTDLISTVVYARHYYGVCPAWVEAEARARLSDLYLLADADLQWSADAVRDRPHSREELQGAFRTTLAEFAARTCFVRGVGPSRLAAALNCIAIQR
jgi:NadR type nicotinamide-nucleotide adenylyltransferase